jgi:FYVE zinc finger
MAASSSRRSGRQGAMSRGFVCFGAPVNPQGGKSLHDRAHRTECAKAAIAAETGLVPKSAAKFCGACNAKFGLVLGEKKVSCKGCGHVFCPKCMAGGENAKAAISSRSSPAAGAPPPDQDEKAPVKGHKCPVAVCMACADSGNGAIVHSSDAHYPEGWIPDAQAARCVDCSKQFSTLKRRHHCRSCGSVMCGECSVKTIVPGFSGKDTLACARCGQSGP